jgi:alpha-ketoglutarate-dependent taurine dioxygenase
MIKYTLHKNNWTVFVDVDLRNLDPEDLNEIVKLCAQYTCVKVRNQDLSVDDEVRIVKTFKNPYILCTPDDVKFNDYAVDNEGYICRVTGKKNDKGNSGIAGHKEEMLWHHENPAARGGGCVAYLYAKENTKNSVTVWNNTVLAYKDLDSETKEKIKDLRVIQFGKVNHSVNRTKEIFDNRFVYEDITVPLVYTNQAGKTGLHLSLYQFEKFQGMTREQSLEIAEPLFKFITREKYCYHHDWEDGDVSFTDQWLGIHKRLAFEDMEKRLVHRATFDYPDNLFKKI